MDWHHFTVTQPLEEEFLYNILTRALYEIHLFNGDPYRYARGMQPRGNANPNDCLRHWNGILLYPIRINDRGSDRLIRRYAGNSSHLFACTDLHRAAHTPTGASAYPYQPAHDR